MRKNTHSMNQCRAKFKELLLAVPLANIAFRSLSKADQRLILNKRKVMLRFIEQSREVIRDVELTKKVGMTEEEAHQVLTTLYRGNE